jgi:hypothetical protein
MYSLALFAEQTDLRYALVVWRSLAQLGAGIAGFLILILNLRIVALRDIITPFWLAGTV